MDRRRFGANPAPTFHFDADPDPDPTFKLYTEQQCPLTLFIFLVSVVGVKFSGFWTVPYFIEIFLKKYSFFLTFGRMDTDPDPDLDRESLDAGLDPDPAKSVRFERTQIRIWIHNTGSEVFVAWED